MVSDDPLLHSYTKLKGIVFGGLFFYLYLLHLIVFISKLLYYSSLNSPIVVLFFFFFIVLKYTNIKRTILTISKCTVQWYEIHSHCCAAVTTIHPQNSFYPVNLKLSPC